MFSGSKGFWHYLVVNHVLLLELTWQHAVITFVSLAIGTVLGISLGLLGYRLPIVRGTILGTAGLILTVPSLAMYALLVGFLGLGTVPVVVALTLYSLLPIVRNTITGLIGVDPAVVDAARGQGMGQWRCLMRVQTPIAWPVILTGVRVSAVIIVGIAALGAIVNGPGLGRLIIDGLRRVGSPVAVDAAIAGTLGVALLGVLLDLLFIVLTHLTTSRGIRE